MDPRPETAPQPRATSAVVATAESKHRSRSLQPTVLRRVGGVTLLDRTVKVLCEAGVTRIVVVAGYRSEDVAATIHSHGLPVELVVNGARKFTGQVVSTGRKRACQIGSVRPLQFQGRMSEEGGAGSGAGAGE